MSLELGFFVPPVPPDEFIKMALRAEEVGYDFITCDDHMIYPFGAPFGEDDQENGIHKEFEELGMTRFILIFLDPEDTERFAQEVLPKLR